jgi:hypothetical protein
LEIEMKETLLRLAAKESAMLSYSLICVGFLSLFAIKSDASQIEPVRVGQESFISRAVYFDSKLWLLTDAGTVSNIAEGSNSQLAVPLPEPAAEMGIYDGELMVLTEARHDGKSWTLRKWSHASWAVVATIPRDQDDIVGIGSSGKTIVLLTTRRMIDLGSGDQKGIALKWPKERTAGITSVLVKADSVLVGFNAGEWGGGLRRIDRKTGEISTFGRKAENEPCAGALNSECDPVNGIALEPWNEGCEVVAIGLIHMMAHGSIVEVCGSAIRTIYSKPYSKLYREDHYSTVPFFGIVAASQRLLAIGSDGLYDIRPEGAVVSALPAFQRIGSVSVSFALPHVVLVVTGINQRHSVSGSVPMLVPRLND